MRCVCIQYEARVTLIGEEPLVDILDDKEYEDDDSSAILVLLENALQPEPFSKCLAVGQWHWAMSLSAT